MRLVLELIAVEYLTLVLSMAIAGWCHRRRSALLPLLCFAMMSLLPLVSWLHEQEVELREAGDMILWLLVLPSAMYLFTSSIGRLLRFQILWIGPCLPAGYAILIWMKQIFIAVFFSSASMLG